MGKKDTFDRRRAGAGTDPRHVQFHVISRVSHTHSSFKSPLKVFRPKSQRRAGKMLRAAGARGVLKRAQTRSFRFTPCLRNENVDLSSIERVSDEVDVCIVGGGPAGLSAAIRLKQLEQEKGKEVRVVVVEKGGEIGECTLVRL